MTETVKEMKTQKKFYLIYQITNTINGKIYIGKHKTDQLDDEYMGSGTYLQRAKEKYGLENFVMTILFQLHNEEEMNLLEKMVVTKEFCDREDTYNLNVGGDGGWDYVNLSSDFAIGLENRKAFHSLGGIASQKQFKDQHDGISITRFRLDNLSEEEYSDFCSRISKSLISYWQENPEQKQFGEKNPMFGKHHLQVSKDKISEKVSGEKNGAYGKHWYRDPNSRDCAMFFDGQQPDGWITGRYQTNPDSYISQRKGTIKVVRKDFSEAKYVSLDVAEKMIATGEWERKTKPMSAKGKKNLSKARREYKKTKWPTKHEAWLKETQEMADYFTKYGYEATCRKFPGRSGTCSPESMLMRFIRARNKYGIHFETKVGKRKFLPAPDEQ